MANSQFIRRGWLNIDTRTIGVSLLREQRNHLIELARFGCSEASSVEINSFLLDGLINLLDEMLDALEIDKIKKSIVKKEEG